MSAFSRSVGRAIGAWFFTRDMGEEEIDFNKIDLKEIQKIYCSSMDAQHHNEIYQNLEEFQAVQNRYNVSAQVYKILKEKTGMAFLTKKEHLTILEEINKNNSENTVHSNRELLDKILKAGILDVDETKFIIDILS